ncbi:MAG: methyltransferase [bacterium]
MGRLKFHESAERERTVASVLARAAASYSTCAVLVIDDLDGHAQAELTAGGFDVTPWTRWKVGSRDASTWPGTPATPYKLVLMRLPRIKDAFEMALHAAASVMDDDGILLVAGANDEGIKSASTLMETVFGDVSTVDTRKHCRVMAARKPNRDEIRGSLKKWRKDIDERIYYPGVFAKGDVDAATRLLIATLPEITGDVLDFACGAGVIAAALPDRKRVWMSDADAIALLAAKENVPEATVVLSDGFTDVDRKFDAIVSNPPIHRGIVEDFSVLRDLIEQAPAHLNVGGKLIFVVQRQVPTKAWPNTYKQIEELGGDTRFKVISASV